MNYSTASILAWRRPSGYLTAAVAELRDLAPYAAIELVLPGGSLIALFCGFIAAGRRRIDRVPLAGWDTCCRRSARNW